ncbi:IclR family transcriptional regulator [Paenibacillus glycanilyticus]|uniref:IclR family transcriptional regulator n=1 Tax=Paenibacillus glycanilyticus TaxID=126569 RepID=A0ABQ6GL82_9BACL|nr:IclR family transcriptional regulator [Paenibacillus glycanilyticus]GLX70367.1 IclR family transcriptional regulator [Paenibacillus glycanilyticus]
MPDYEVSSLKKGLQILNLLKDNRRLNLTDIAKEIEVNKTTVFRLLHTLEEMKYVIKMGKEYELHPMLFDGKPSFRETIKWSKLQTLCRLGEEVKKDVFVGTLDDEGTGIHVRQVYEAEMGQLVDRPLNGVVPACHTAAGKALLAELNRSEQLRIFEHIDPRQATGHAFTDPDLFVRHLDAIRQQGFATDYEELHAGVQCIAAPLFYGEKVVASIAVASARHEARNLTGKVIQAAKEITAEMNAYSKSAVRD